MKKTICVLIMWMMFTALNAFGIEYPEATSWINDYAGVLNSNQKQELDALLKEFDNKTTTQIFVSIMDRIPSGTSLDKYVNERQGDYYNGIRQGLQGIILATHEGYTFPSTAERSTTAPIPQPQPHRSFGLGSVELITLGITIVVVTTMLNFLQILITIHGL